MSSNPQKPVTLGPLDALGTLPPLGMVRKYLPDMHVHLTGLVLGGMWAAFSGPFRGDRGAKTYRQHVAHALVRQTSRFTVKHVQYGFRSRRP